MSTLIIANSSSCPLRSLPLPPTPPPPRASHAQATAHLLFCHFLSVLLSVPRVHSFLLLSSIPLHEYITFCLTIHLLIDNWTVSTFFAYLD